MVSIVACYQEGPGFNYLSWHVKPVVPVPTWVLSGYSGFLPESKDTLVRLIGHSNRIGRILNEQQYSANVKQWTAALCGILV